MFSMWLSLCHLTACLFRSLKPWLDSKISSYNTYPKKFLFKSRLNKELIYLPIYHFLLLLHVTKPLALSFLFSFSQTMLQDQGLELRSQVISLRSQLDTSQAVQRDFVQLSQSLQVPRPNTWPNKQMFTHRFFLISVLLFKAEAQTTCWILFDSILICLWFINHLSHPMQCTPVPRSYFWCVSELAENSLWIVISYHWLFDQMNNPAYNSFSTAVIFPGENGADSSGRVSGSSQAHPRRGTWRRKWPA